MAFLKRDGAAGRRVGVLRQARRPSASDPQVLALFDRAVADLDRAGAEIIDPFVIPEFDRFPPSLHPLSEVKAAIARYLARTGPTFPKSLSDIMASGKFPSLHEVGLIETASAPAPGDDPVVNQLEADEARMRTAYLAAMEESRMG
jgi:Asp-tRNA(Asn)/Glu-tRNA(Gln) amidotransferase A subunit family amidase